MYATTDVDGGECTEEQTLRLGVVLKEKKSMHHEDGGKRRTAVGCMYLAESVAIPEAVVVALAIAPLVPVRWGSVLCFR